MRRRCILAAFLAVLPLGADDRTDALDTVAPLATALANSDDDSFRRTLPSNLPRSAELRENLTALMAQAEVTSSVEVIRVDKGSADLDWYMELKSRQTRTVVERRRETVRIRFRKRKLESIEPVSFFAPPRADQKEH